jgi:GNAT superfamily N-acetyltransferase
VETRKMNDHSIRRVTPREAPVVARHRLRMFQDMGQVPPDLAAKLQQSSERAVAGLLSTGEYIGWFAVTASGEVIAGAGVHIKAQLPRISLTGDAVEDSPVPLVVNVYTEPDWRGRGVARELMRHLMNWAVEQDYERVVLHASDAARPLYVSLDFAATNEMRWSPRRDTR